MRLDVIAVEDLRRHRRQTIQPAATVTAIVGPNGIGKTTLLEAAHLAMTGTSFTGTPTGELIRHGCDAGAIELRAVAGGAPTEVTITLRARRSISLDGTRADGPALRRRFACIPFLPDALDLIKRGPTVRRTMLDRAIINMAGLYGDFQGIVGEVVPALESFEPLRLESETEEEVDSEKAAG